MLDVPALCRKLCFPLIYSPSHQFTVHLINGVLDTVTPVSVVLGVQIILINCQCLILAGWHRLKKSPQGMLGIYRPFYWERRAHNSKCVNGSASKLLFSLFFLVVKALRTLVEKCLAYIQDHVEAWKYVKLQGWRQLHIICITQSLSAASNNNAPESEGHKLSFLALQRTADCNFSRHMPVFIINKTSAVTSVTLSPFSSGSSRK